MNKNYPDLHAAATFRSSVPTLDDSEEEFELVLDDEEEEVAPEPGDEFGLILDDDDNDAPSATTIPATVQPAGNSSISRPLPGNRRRLLYAEFPAASPEDMEKAFPTGYAARHGNEVEKWRLKHFTALVAPSGAPLTRRDLPEELRSLSPEASKIAAKRLLYRIMASRMCRSADKAFRPGQQRAIMKIDAERQSHTG